jgi:hypothetical protein
MSDLVIIAIVQSLPMSVVGLASAWFSYRASVHSKAGLEVSRQTEHNTNHMKDELVALTQKSSHAEGILEGKRISEQSRE